jgi:hypothetical protein
LNDTLIVTPQENRNGWVNPEDLASMPQCIAQQDQKIWLDAMTQCTGRQCTRHFGPLICTHHQWLTQLTCLNAAFSPDVVEHYIEYCSRSILAKAQLYQWIRQVTDRTWLVEVGDANELQNLSPSSLVQGYASSEIANKAPVCLTHSASALSGEPFKRVLASCSFTGAAVHLGNAARPWEFSESSRSMTSLDVETSGYDLTGGNIGFDDYLDKACICSAFKIDWEKEPCSRSDGVEMTEERLWMYATCGKTSLPPDWTDALKTTEFHYISIDAWHWPKCVDDLSNQVTKLREQCSTDACELDSGGYCKIKRAIDRACFCRNINYESCGPPCQIFETRIDYVKWLSGVCGGIQGWHGLPHDWPRLAAPTSSDMIPWRWSVKPFDESDIDNHIGTRPVKPMQSCASNEWKLGVIALVNMATLGVVCFSRSTQAYRFASDFMRYFQSSNWFFTGLSITASQLLANWFNAMLVQSTPGYEHVPIISLMLLWCSMPRLTWLPTLFVGRQTFKDISIPVVASYVFAEILLQIGSAYYMLQTIRYGLEHNFYFGILEGAERKRSATMMYGGALLWLIVIVAALVQLARFAQAMVALRETENTSLPKWQGRARAPATIAEELTAQADERCALLGERFIRAEPPRSRYSTIYGTLPPKTQGNRISTTTIANAYVIMIGILSFLWVTQWLFWAGFIGLSSKEYVFVPIPILTQLTNLDTVHLSSCSSRFSGLSHRRRASCLELSEMPCTYCDECTLSGTQSHGQQTCNLRVQ